MPSACEFVFDYGPDMMHTQSRNLIQTDHALSWQIFLGPATGASCAIGFR